MADWQLWLETQMPLFSGMLMLSVFSLITVIFGLPFLVLSLPADYFTGEERRHFQGRHAVIRLLALILKNLFGVILLVAGILMLVLPGQGLLTILGGLLLMDFPGKFRLERYLASRPRIARTLNWIRKKGNKPRFKRVRRQR